MQPILNTVFEQPFDVAAFFRPFDNRPDLFFRRTALHGQVHIYRFHKTFFIRPGRDRRARQGNPPSAGRDLYRQQQTATQRAQKRGDRVRRAAASTHGLRLIKRPGERSGLDVDGQAIGLSGGKRVAKAAAGLFGCVLPGLLIRFVPSSGIRTARFIHVVLLALRRPL